MTFLSEMDPQTGMIDAEAVRGKGADLREAYNAAQPFPHILIDDFLPPEILEMCLAEFERDQSDKRSFDRDQERFKSEFKPDLMSQAPRNLFYAFNSRPFISMIENITGIKGLIPDPYFLGAGFHEIKTGGHLSIHADFNHHKLMNLERRINALIYLNHDWKEEYGGTLELWENDMSACAKSFVPLFNRCVIFNTTSHSNHGNPHPINHPEGRSRKSIALYYYTATWAGEKRSHTTQFRPRQGSEDRSDWSVRTRELIDDLLPPVLRRAITKKRAADEVETHDA